MAIKANFRPSDITKILQAQIDKIDKTVLNRFGEIGERFIVDARSTNTYSDQTGNLRSSIGFVILKDGQQLLAAFPGDKPTGVATGKKVAAEVASQYNKGYVLIVVAGMDYAASVESRNKDVITGSSPAAVDRLQKAMARITKQMDKIK